MAKHKQQPISQPTGQDMLIIITGDPIDSARLTTEWGEKLGTALARDVAPAQMRNIFGMVRQIEMNWKTDDDQSARRNLILLKPKLRYQSERKNEIETLADVLIAGIDLVDGDSGNLEAREKYQRFVDFFEAILAYHKAAGGR